MGRLVGGLRGGYRKGQVQRRVGEKVEERRGGVAHLVPQWEDVVKEERAWIRVLRVPTS